MSLDEFNELRLKNPNELTTEQKKMMKEIRESKPMPDETTLLQKVIPFNRIGKYLDGSYTQVGGYITEAADVAHLEIIRIFLIVKD